MKGDIEVSVYCLAYNHGRYIRKTLDGFINQKTTFKYEVVVHDDASTDDTAKIIEEYAVRYPEIIKPIYQKENQYSKGISILRKFIEPSLKSTKYYAICEGDDYWIDENKLQMQYEYMESHEKCSMCVHNTMRVDEDGSDVHMLFNTSNNDLDYCPEEIIVAGGGGLFHTSSFFWRKDFGLCVPDGFKIQGIGDYNRAIYLSTVGEVHYIARIMSAYRQGSVNSWVKGIIGDSSKHAKHYERIVDGLKRMDKATEGKYQKAFDTAIGNYLFTICELKRDYKTILSDPKLRKIYRDKPLKQRIKISLKMLLK